ncbi:hypothetical protein [Actinoplanes xinjiangensis]|uniref:hypothetical protein n=1 Tax=Actinoplanes xinjiangensis TaxID=512350 RepID=UPI0034188FA6
MLTTVGQVADRALEPGITVVVGPDEDDPRDQPLSGSGMPDRTGPPATGPADRGGAVAADRGRRPVRQPGAR